MGARLSRVGWLLVATALPELLLLWFVSVEALYYVAFVALIPLGALRLGIAGAVLSRRGRAPRAAWALEIVHSAFLILLLALVDGNTLRYSGVSESVPLALWVSLAAWPFAMSLVCIAALATQTGH